MPTYQYACTECGERLEVVQKFSDDALTVCPVCSGRLRKVFSAAAIVFKGSGFYRNDSRSSSGKSTITSESKGGDAKGGESGKGGADKGPTAPSDKPFGQSSGSGKGGTSADSAGGSKSGASSGSGGSGSGGSGSGSKASSGSKVA